MPYSVAHRKQRQKEWSKRRMASVTRLRIALAVLEEYGCLWEYERACSDAGLADPLLVPEPQPRVRTGQFAASGQRRRRAA